MKRAFVSWSGGKDCTFAIYKFLQSASQIEVVVLLNMNRATTQNAHRLSSALVHLQAQRLGISLIQETIEEGRDYLWHFERILLEFKEQGIDYGIFGDIYLEPHRRWIEDNCKRVGIEPIFPLWGMNVVDIFDEFVKVGFKAQIISVRNDSRFIPLLGKSLSKDLRVKMMSYDGFDVCGENGEYHTFVTDGPIFKSALDFTITGVYKDEKIVANNLDIMQ